MCNACGNVCCGSDQFEKCGCDGCECEECWSDEPEADGDDEFYEMRSGAGETIPLVTVEHGGCGADPCQRLAVAPTPSKGEAVAAELFRFACKQLD